MSFTASAQKDLQLNRETNYSAWGNLAWLREGERAGEGGGREEEGKRGEEAEGGGGGTNLIDQT